MEEERQAVLSWPQYLARGVSPRAGPSTDGEEEVSVERANKVLDKLGAIFKDDLCLTPFSRTMAVEFVKVSTKNVGRLGLQLSLPRPVTRLRYRLLAAVTISRGSCSSF